MELNRITAGKVMLTAALCAAIAFAIEPRQAGAQPGPQDAQPDAARPSPPPPAPESVQTFMLKNAVEQNDLNDIQTDLRNVLGPRSRVFAAQSQNAITVRGTQEDLETAQKLIAELDVRRQVYRLTFTLADVEGGKRTASQQVVLMAVLGQKATFKLGSRVPIVTGSTVDGKTANTQVQYQDLGLNIQATVGGSPEALQLRTMVAQSSVADDKSVVGAQDPVIRQTVLDESSQLTQGKPMVIGSLDVPGSTRRQEIEVVAELVR
jgi:type II secretory pathway component GspD/PulD (secretin)